MRAPRSLQLRLALGLGLGLTVLWLVAASVTATLLRHEMDEVFDATLAETGQRLLPLAVMDVLGREEDGITQQIATLRQHDEVFTYVVRDAQGRVLLRSHGAEDALFPPFDGVGFRQNATHRFYDDAALQNSITITVAEPLAHRASVAREMQIGLGLPLLVVVPLSLAILIGAVQLSFRPLRRFRSALAQRGAQNLTALPDAGLPSELEPMAVAVNQLLARLRAAFEAERSFAANAAHELRTPVAGAIAQVQRLRAETQDPQAERRAGEVEASLKRLTRLSEKLMQLARAEGGRLRSGTASDLRPVLRLMVADAERAGGAGRLKLTLPEVPVLSDIDPDAFGILCRNLIENALKHGDPGGSVEVGLSAAARLTVVNMAPVVPPEALARLTGRFERAAGAAEGSGLGLAIVRTIAERADGKLVLLSPAEGRETGFEVRVDLPQAA
ncbi:two-component system, OmpR family, sensor kinase [Gemmobacter aquatilis]|uniref:histidine kinase n=1 Tax=Gemmobacter aquatilis TaxID=933059 RepID=A0A1H8FLL9_9RHOB|nr:ATP-binding protein [Gemmobacter aquatilis]SEN32556.1 two-component system, OmpR family, sensor kinase [Gemmobacter aquatilis]